MSRHANVRKLKPRCKAVMFETISSTQRVYQETGGADIDFAIEAARQAYEIALHRAKRYIPPENGRGRDPLSEVNKAVRELRMLIQQREKKLAQCRRDIDETGEAEEQQHADEKTEQVQADDGSPVSSAAPVESTDEPTPEQQHDQASR